MLCKCIQFYRGSDTSAYEVSEVLNPVDLKSSAFQIWTPGSALIPLNFPCGTTPYPSGNIGQATLSKVASVVANAISH
jgi:hypothetical protein